MKNKNINKNQNINIFKNSKNINYYINDLFDNYIYLLKKSNNNSDVNIDNNLSNKIAEAEGEKKNKNHGTNIEDKKESVLKNIIMKIKNNFLLKKKI